MSFAGETLGYRYPAADSSFVSEYLLNRRLYCGPFSSSCWDAVSKSCQRLSLRDSKADITSIGESLVTTFVTRKVLSDCHDGCVNSIEYNEDASLLVTGSDDLAVGLFSTNDWSLVKKIPTEHRANIFSAIMMPQTNDTKVLSCGLDGGIILTDAVTGEGYVIHRERFAMGTKLLPIFSSRSGFGSPPVAVAGLESGGFLFVDTRMKKVVHTAEFYREIPRSNGTRSPINCMALHPTQTNIVVVGSDSVSAYLCDLRFLSRSSEAQCSPQSYFSQISCIKGKSSSKGIGGVAFSEGGDRLLINYKDEDLYCVEWIQFISSYNEAISESDVPPEHTIQMRRDRVSPETLAVFNGIHPIVERDVKDASEYSDSSVKSAGDIYLSRLFGGTPKSPAARPRTIKYQGRVNSLTMFKEATFLLGDEYVATGGDNGKVYFWEASSGKAVHTTKGDDDVVNGVLYHPSHPYTLVACGIDKSAKVMIAHIEDYQQTIRESAMEDVTTLLIWPHTNCHSDQLAMFEPEPNSTAANISNGSELLPEGLDLSQMAMLSTGQQSFIFRNILLSLSNQDEIRLSRYILQDARESAGRGRATVSESAFLTAMDQASAARETTSPLTDMQIESRALLPQRTDVSGEDDNSWEDTDGDGDSDEYTIYEEGESGWFDDMEFEMALEDSDFGNFFSPLDTDDDNDDSETEYNAIEDMKKRDDLSQTFAPMFYADWEPIQLLYYNAFIIDFFLFRVLREPDESHDNTTKIQGNCMKLLSRIIGVLQWFPQSTLAQSSYEQLAKFLNELFIEYSEMQPFDELEEVPSSSCLPEDIIRATSYHMETLSPRTLSKIARDEVDREASGKKCRVRQEKKRSKKATRSHRAPESPVLRKKSSGVEDQRQGNSFKSRKRICGAVFEETSLEKGQCDPHMTPPVPAYVLSISRLYGIQNKFKEDHHALIHIVREMYGRMRKPNNKLWESIFDVILTDVESDTAEEEKSSDDDNPPVRRDFKEGSLQSSEKAKSSFGSVADSQFCEGSVDVSIGEYIDMLAADSKGSTDLDHIFEHCVPPRPSEVMEQFVRNGELILEEVYRLLAIIKHRDKVPIAVAWDLVKWNVLRPTHADEGSSTQNQEYSPPYTYELMKVHLLLKLFELYIFPHVQFPVCNEGRTRRLLLACTQYAMLRSCIAFMLGQANVMLAGGVIPLLKLAQTMFLPSCTTTFSVVCNDITMIPRKASKLCMSVFALQAMANCPPTDSCDRNISGIAKEVEQHVILLKKKVARLEEDFEESSDHTKKWIEELLIGIKEKLDSYIKEGNIPKINL